MATKKIEIQDSNGNVYYPHTEASVVKNGNTTVAAQLNDLTKRVELNLDAMTSVAEGENKVILNVIVQTEDSIFKTVNGEFEIQKEGIYLIEYNLGLYDNSLNNYIDISIKKNNNKIAISNNVAVNGWYLSLTLIKSCNLIKGDILSFYETHAGKASTINNNPMYTNIKVTYIGGI